jgi:hypothetical protein
LFKDLTNKTIALKSYPQYRVVLIKASVSEALIIFTLKGGVELQNYPIGLMCGRCGIFYRQNILVDFFFKEIVKTEFRFY